jgi:hypothetical protein
MPTNVYFDQRVSSEQNLVEDLIIEALRIYGQEVYYIPRSVIRQDEILNEDYSQYASAYMIEMYVADTGGFQGEGHLLSKFGLEIRDQVTFVVSRSRFTNLVNIDSNAIASDRPREGDLIYLPMTNAMFEIQFVEHEQPFYQLQNLPTYQLQCELFEYNSEMFETGIREIDQFEELYGAQYVIEIEGGAVGFRPGEKIKQDIGDGVTIFGEVAFFAQTQEQNPITGAVRKGNLYLTQTRSSDGQLKFWREGINIESLDDDNKNDWTVTKLYDISSPNLGLPQDPLAQNSNFELDADEIIDFSEINPFGEPRV